MWIKLLGLDIIYIHLLDIYKTILRSAFEVKFAFMSVPNIKVFKRFQRIWLNINNMYFNTRLKDEVIIGLLHICI